MTESPRHFSFVYLYTCTYRWERRVDDRGRVYYVDHNTRTTTWVRPNTDLLAAHSQWQQNNNARSQSQFNQRFLYPNQQDQMTQHTPSESDMYGPLPEGWEKRIDKTGRVRWPTRHITHYSPFMLVYSLVSMCWKTRFSSLESRKCKHT